MRRTSVTEPLMVLPARQQDDGGVRRYDYSPRALTILTSFASLGGFLFGFDTGIINGALLILARDFDLSTFQKEVVVSSAIAAAMVGALITSKISGKYGRRWSILIMSSIFVAGSVILAGVPVKYGDNVAFAILIVGRIVAGLGIGGASMVVPVYS